MSDDVTAASRFRRLFSEDSRSSSLAEALGWSNRTTFFISLAFSAVVFTVCNCAYLAHGVNDDWALSNALSGRWGEPQGITLFLNALMCQLVFWLNTTLGGPNWFFVLEFSTIYLSFLAITYMALNWSSAVLALPMISAFLVLAMPGCTWEVNFTYAAFSACCAGLMMLLFSLEQRRRSMALLVLGFCFVFVGILWRANMFLVAIPICGLAALFQLAFVRQGDVGLPMHRAVLRLWPFAVALALLGGALLYHGAIWGDSVLDEWFQYNEARSTFSDYPKKPYGEIAEEMNAAGVSEVDYEMLSGWITEDPDFFTTDLISTVNGIALKSSDTSIGRIAYSFARYAYRVLTDVKLFLLIALVLAASWLVFDRRGKAFAACLVALAFLLGTAFLVVGRLPERVNYPMWLFVFGSICALSSAGGRGASASPRVPESRRMRARHTAFRVLVAACLLTPLVSSAMILQKAATMFCPERVQAIVAPSSFKVESALLDYLDENPEAVVVMNTSSFFDVVYANYMIAPCSEQATARIIGLGGWATRSPYTTGRNERADMANPLKGLVDNEHAVYVAASDKTVKLIQSYLMEHYYPDVTYDQIGALDSYSGKRDALLVFKFGRKA